MIATETTNDATARIDTLLAEYRDILDQREELAAQDRELSKRKAALDAELQAFHQQTGLNKIGNDSLSVSFDEAFRATYEPEKWPEIVKWAVETNNTHIVQRRLTDAKVIDLFDNDVAFPDGLNLEKYTKISHRRK